jgi:hypothetical protein
MENFAVDRDHLARVNHNFVANHELDDGPGHDRAIADDPGGLGLEFE